ncbi:MAG: hypothetical protein IJQ68_03710 [Methanobrevibacter sp.]|uniref:hypothetical protein n=1 Tax=Methanobrevibacter sp. TaxID=66852 RepID=UPI0025FBECDA|nr:hypothetical protein [Methanobrevibacter sp.]MBR0271084.1 hypothetical protein [Methanobrevibacter sp.]
MSDIINKLKSSDEKVTNLELLDYVIALQLSKIEEYNEDMDLPSSKISEDAENSMSNLIDLLKLREHYKRRK